LFFWFLKLPIGNCTPHIPQSSWEKNTPGSWNATLHRSIEVYPLLIHATLLSSRHVGEVGNQRMDSIGLESLRLSQQTRLIWCWCSLSHMQDAATPRHPIYKYAALSDASLRRK
jgi:hypothetical protein